MQILLHRTEATYKIKKYILFRFLIWKDTLLMILTSWWSFRPADDDSDLPGDPKRSIPLFGVSGGAQVFAKQLKRHISGFPTKNLTISDQYFQRFHCQKKDICNSAVFSPTALLQISFVEIILRLPVDISLKENRIPPLGPSCSRLAFLPRQRRGI